MKNLILIILLLFAAKAQSTIYHVSSSGGDFATLAEVSAANFVAGDQVLFNKGDTFFGTLIIHNSGTSGNPIVIAAYGTGANPVITGFITITSGWTNEGGGIYSKTIPVESAPQMVAIDGIQYAMGRWPNTTWRTITGVSGSTQITDSGLTETPNWTGAEVVVRLNRWVIDRKTITSQSTTQLNFSTTSYAPQSGWGYFIQNSLSTLDTYGEWYYNTATSKLYMFFGGVDPATKTVKVSSVDKLISSSGSKYITIDNITLTGSNLGAVYRNSTDYTASNFIIQNCTISFSGNYAIYAERSSTVTVSNCTITDTNNTALLLDGQYGSANNVNNCTITNTATIPGLSGNGDMQGLAIKSTVQNTVLEYNHIVNTGYIPIYFGGANSLIQKNLIDNFCFVKDDGGGIYCYHDVAVNKRVLNNIIINSQGAFGTVETSGTPDETSSGRGLYSDQLCKNILYDSNTIANMSASAIHINTSDIITIQNNTIFQTLSFLDVNRWSSTWFTDSIRFMGNVVASTINVNAPGKGAFWYAVQVSGAYYENGTIDHEAASIGVFDNNYYASNVDHQALVYTSNTPFTVKNYTGAQWKSLELDTHSTFLTGRTDANIYRLEYNDTKIPKTVELGTALKDVNGNSYTSVTIAPFASLILIDLPPVKALIDDTGRPLVDDNGNLLITQ